jgi:hypothetical protein
MEKTEQTIESPPPLPERCCGRCGHGVEVRIPPNLAIMVQCRALPPIPVLMPAPNGQAMVQSTWPINPPSLCCGMFAPKVPSAGA